MPFVRPNVVSLYKRNIISFCIPKFICENTDIDHRGANVWQCRWYVSNKLLKFHLLSLTYKINILFEPSNRMPDSVLHSTLFVSTKIRSICSIVLYIWGDHTKGSWVNMNQLLFSTQKSALILRERQNTTDLDRAHTILPESIKISIIYELLWTSQLLSEIWIKEILLCSGRSERIMCRRFGHSSVVYQNCSWKWGWSLCLYRRASPSIPAGLYNQSSSNLIKSPWISGNSQLKWFGGAEYNKIPRNSSF
jgi:hypothetical protein